MVEGVAAGIGVLLLTAAISGSLAWAEADRDSVLWALALALIGLLVDVYFIVRFVHWAWLTPIPFLDSVG